ncbi:MAG: hypothetical protein F6K34_13040, partial [Okeania sp. SIO4D6]|nr:hypothetical protein [Okeania sp. SIO4D6]
SSKFCAEFFLDKGELIIFLWIPYKGGESSRIGRSRIWTDWQDKALIEGYVSSGVGTEINRHKRSMQKLIEAIEIGGNYSQFSIDIGNRIYYFSLPISKNMREKYIKAVLRIMKYPKKPKPLTCEDMELFKHYKKLWEARIGEELKT